MEMETKRNGRRGSRPSQNEVHADSLGDGKVGFHPDLGVPIISPHLRPLLQPGFTLVEAVLALAIMCISAFSLMAAASQCLQVARTARNYHTAVFVLDRAELEYPFLPTNEVNDNIVEPITYDNGYTYSRTVDPVETEDDSDKDMFIVRSRVSWSTKGKESFEEVSTYLYSTNHL